jgi:hypothetical protein
MSFATAKRLLDRRPSILALIKLIDAPAAILFFVALVPRQAELLPSQTAAQRLAAPTIVQVASITSPVCINDLRRSTAKTSRNALIRLPVNCYRCPYSENFERAEPRLSKSSSDIGMLNTALRRSRERNISLFVPL